jgi:hypothetical protein
VALQVALVGKRLVAGLAVVALVARRGGLVVGHVVVVLVSLQQLLIKTTKRNVASATAYQNNKT